MTNIRLGVIISFKIIIGYNECMLKNKKGHCINMKQKNFYSTGEVADLLGISRATVTRKFEKGILKGKKNPITGDRRISSESLKIFMKQYNLSSISLMSESTAILIVTADEQFKSLIHEVLGNNDNYELIAYSLGTEALVTCAKETAKLIIIDHELPDIPGNEVINTLRRMNALEGVKILHYDNDGWGESFSGIDNEDSIERKECNIQLLRKKINNLFNLETEEFETSGTFQHERQWPRMKVNVHAKIWLYDPENPSRGENGTALIKDISGGGAFLHNIKFERGFPIFENFRLRISADIYPLENWTAKLKVLRLQSDGTFSAGVQFIEISTTDKEKIINLNL